MGTVLLDTLYSVLKALVGASNQEKTLIGAFSVIVKTDGSFAALPIIVTSGGNATPGVPSVGWITLFVDEARGPSWVQVIR